MEKSEVQKWVDENAEPLKHRYGLDHWRLIINIEPIEAKDDGSIVPMRVRIKPEYERATIWINYPHLNDEKELETHFKHELNHLLLAPFEMLYNSICDSLPLETQKLIPTLWNQADELAVRNLERYQEREEAQWTH